MKMKRPFRKAILSCSSNAINNQTVKSLKGLFHDIIWIETNSQSSSHKVAHLRDDGQGRHNTKNAFGDVSDPKAMRAKGTGLLGAI